MKAIVTKWGPLALFAIGVLVLTMNLFQGGAPAPQAEEPVNWNIGTENIWFAMTLVLVTMITARWINLMKKPLPTGAAAGTIPQPRFNSNIVWLIAGAIIVLILGRALVYNEEINPSWDEIFTMAAAVLVVGALVLGAYKDMTKGGSGKAVIVMWRIGAAVFVLAAIIVWLVGPSLINGLMDGLQHSAQSGVSSVIETQTLNGVETHQIKWEEFAGVDWWRFFSIAFGCALAFIFVHQYFGKNKIVVTTAAVVACIAFVMLAYIFATKWEATNNIIEGVVELNPALGETHYASLANVDSTVVAGIGPYDDVVLTLRYSEPGKTCYPWWEPTQHWMDNHGHESWFDYCSFMTQTAGGGSKSRRLSLSDTMREGMKDNGVTLDLTIERRCSPVPFDPCGGQ